MVSADSPTAGRRRDRARRAAPIALGNKIVIGPRILAPPVVVSQPPCHPQLHRNLCLRPQLRERPSEEGQKCRISPQIDCRVFQHPCPDGTGAWRSADPPRTLPAVELQEQVLADCQQGLPGWRGLGTEAFEFDPPKGFSSFTMGVRAREPADPPAVLYRRLAGKENAILDGRAERSVFCHLADAGLAARCYLYTESFRLEAFYRGRTLTPEDLDDDAVLTGIGEQLARFHQQQPEGVPQPGFFELLHDKWGPMARYVLEDCRDRFPDRERALCEPLGAITSEQTRRRVAAMIPEGPLLFCHNDTYHGNVMRLESGQIRLLDFEFSCRNHPAFDFANLFAETVMVHGLPDPPHFRIDPPRYDDGSIRTLVTAYLTAGRGEASESEVSRLVAQTRAMIPLSDYMYAMAALPLALEPIQKIRFLPYASQRFARFMST